MNDLPILMKGCNVEEFLKELNTGEFFDYAFPFSFQEILLCGRRLGLQIQACVTPPHRCVVNSKYIPIDGGLASVKQLGKLKNLLFVLPMRPFRKILGFRVGKRQKPCPDVYGMVDQEFSGEGVRIKSISGEFADVVYSEFEFLNLIKNGSISVYRKLQF